jgi:hypothetical protein
MKCMKHMKKVTAPTRNIKIPGRGRPFTTEYAEDTEPRRGDSILLFWVLTRIYG